MRTTNVPQYEKVFNKCYSILFRIIFSNTASSYNFTMCVEFPYCFFSKGCGVRRVSLMDPALELIQTVTGITSGTAAVRPMILVPVCTMDLDHFLNHVLKHYLDLSVLFLMLWSLISVFMLTHKCCWFLMVILLNILIIMMTW